MTAEQALDIYAKNESLAAYGIIYDYVTVNEGCDFDTEELEGVIERAKICNTKEP